MKLDPIQPRFLRFRSHYKVYVFGFIILSFLVLSFWGVRFTEDHFKVVIQENTYELFFSFLYFFISAVFYMFWLRPRLKRSIQVFEDHVLVNHVDHRDTIAYADIESLNVVAWSIFYVKMKNGVKHYFNSGFERVDYIWEGIYKSRPDLISQEDYDKFLVKLVQYDHHQKRKEWFFKHKIIDVFHWAVLPIMFVFLAWVLQSGTIVINHQALYFFRLFMYAWLIILSTSFIYSIILKKFIFDKRIVYQMENAEEKVRDLEFEGVILHRSKVFQIATTTFVLALLVKFDVNLYSVSKVKEDIASFKLKKGNTILIDNRYNCMSCKYRLQDGDFIVFGKGIIGQVLATEGDMVGQIAQDKVGRMIASENVQEVPRGHIAVKAANGRDIVFVKIDDLIGKIQN